MIEQLLDWDMSLFLFLNGNGISFLDSFWLLMSDSRVNFLIYIFMAGWYFKLKMIAKRQYIELKPKKEWHFKLKTIEEFSILLIVVILMITVTDQTTNLFKYGFQRLRPCHNPLLIEGSTLRLVKDSCGGLYSFFSAHASNSFALATFFSLIFRIYPKTRRFLFSIATLIAFSRVFIGVHYPLDIFSGAIFGMLMGVLFYFTARYILRRKFNRKIFELS